VNHRIFVWGFSDPLLPSFGVTVGAINGPTNLWLNISSLLTHGKFTPCVNKAIINLFFHNSRPNVVPSCPVFFPQRVLKTIALQIKLSGYNDPPNQTITPTFFSPASSTVSPPKSFLRPPRAYPFLLFLFTVFCLRLIPAIFSILLFFMFGLEALLFYFFLFHFDGVCFLCFACFSFLLSWFQFPTWGR